LTQLFGFGLYGVGLVNAILLILWIWVARETRQEYQQALEKTAPRLSRQTVAVESEAA
jgi:hypothetical protein